MPFQEPQAEIGKRAIVVNEPRNAADQQHGHVPRTCEVHCLHRFGLGPAKGTIEAFEDKFGIERRRPKIVDGAHIGN